MANPAGGKPSADPRFKAITDAIDEACKLAASRTPVTPSSFRDFGCLTPETQLKFSRVGDMLDSLARQKGS